MDRILEAIERDWPTKRILVVGDLMLDKYIWGEVERISPEAPVPVVRALRNSEQPGGAANVAMNLAGLGAQVVAVGVVGADDDALRLQSCLKRSGVECAAVEAPGFPTVSKLRILGGSQQMLRLDVERREGFSPETYERLRSSILERLPGAGAIILSDYAKGVLTDEVCRETIEAARRLGIPVLVDPKTRNFERYRGATTISPNLHELAAAVGENSHNLGTLLQRAKALVPELDLEFLIVTLGEKGIAVLWETSELLAPAVARQVFDVSGAGDTVIAVLALSIASGLGIETAVRLANIAAGVVVSKLGTVPVEKSELLAALSAPRGQPQPEDKVVALDHLVGRVAAWRAAGQQIAFTNGCFDLIHVGHIAVLQQAKGEADRLVVGVNSDGSVKRLKGDKRPIVEEDERARVLAALGCVDAVVLFSEDTPLRVIEAIRPDVLVKGGDYQEETIVGAFEVRSWGGRVKIVRTVEGFSTTKLLHKSQG